MFNMNNNTQNIEKNIVVVLELTESPVSPVFPIPGANGSEIGLMTFCPVRNRHCLRMPLEVYRKHKTNIAMARRRFFQIVFDIEITEPAEQPIEIAEPKTAELEAEIAQFQKTKKRGRPAKDIIIEQ